MSTNQMSRQHSSDIATGNTIVASHLNDEFNHIQTKFNSNDQKQDDLIAGIEPFDIIKATTNVTTNTIIEITSNQGVTIDSVVCKDGMVTVSGTPTVSGQIGYASNTLTHHNGTAVATVETTLNQGFIILEDRKAAGTNGGTFTSGARRTRDLNTEVVDIENHCTLSANQFTLAAGTYRVFAESTGFLVDGHRCWVRNVTDGVDVAFGMSAFSSSASLNCNTVATAWGRFTIASSKTFELQAQCHFTNAGDGFGVQANGIDTEIYSRVTLWKEAA